MKHRTAFTLVELLISLVLVVVIAVFVGPAMERRKKRSNHVHCRNNLQNLATAARRYHDDYGSFPPAYVADTEGKPLYSWRVLLLPYLGAKETYEFHLDEPWDSEHNLTLFRSMPFQYYDYPDDAWGHSTSAKTSPEDRRLTSYMMVVGPNTISGGENATKMDDIVDGPEKTILFVETRKKVPWSAPIDLPLELLDRGVVTGKTGENDEGLGSNHRDGLTNIVLADGTAVTLLPDAKPDMLKSLAVIDDGGPEDWQPVE